MMLNISIKVKPPKKKVKRKTRDEILVARHKEKLAVQRKLKKELAKQKAFLNGEVEMISTGELIIVDEVQEVHPRHRDGVFMLLEKLIEKKSKLVIGRRKGDVPISYADCSKSKEILGWTSKLSIEESIASSWNWENNN